MSIGIELNINPSRPDPEGGEKIKNHTSSWCLKRFYKDLKSLHKTFWGTSKKYENKDSS